MKLISDLWRVESVNGLRCFFQFTSSYTIKYLFFNKSIKFMKMFDWILNTPLKGVP